MLGGCRFRSLLDLFMALIEFDAEITHKIPVSSRVNPSGCVQKQWRRYMRHLRPLFLFLCALVLCASGIDAQDSAEPARTPQTTPDRPKRPSIRAVHDCRDGRGLDYEFWKPERIIEGERYPLVLCLHGAGGSTAAPKVLLQGDTPCYILAPSVPPKECSWAGRRTPGLPWALELLDALVAEHPIDPERIYVTGQSMGGQGTWGALSARPDFFAAAVPVCGGWQGGDAERFKHVPVWVFHGDADTVVPVRYSQEMVAALEASGGAPKYTELPGVGHNAWTPAYARDDLWTWLFSQRRAAEKEPVPATEQDDPDES